MMKPIKIEVSSFDELCAIADFDMLVCQETIEDPRGQQSRLFDPERQEEIPWSEFFAWPVLVNSFSDRTIADADCHDSDEPEESPYTKLQRPMACAAEGATVILSVDASNPRNLMFAAGFLAYARLYAITQLSEDEIGDTAAAGARDEDIRDDEGEVIRYFYHDGMLSYNHYHPFPVYKSKGRIKGCCSDFATDQIEAIVWHRRFALGGQDSYDKWRHENIGVTPQSPQPPDMVLMCPELWQRNFVEQAVDDGRNFKALAWMPGNRIVSFAQRIGTGAIIVSPQALLDWFRKSQFAGGAWDAVCFAEMDGAVDAPRPNSKVQEEKVKHLEVEELGFSVTNGAWLRVRLHRSTNWKYKISLCDLGLTVDRHGAPNKRLKCFGEAYFNFDEDDSKGWVAPTGQDGSAYGVLKTECSNLKRALVDWFRDKKSLELEGIQSVIKVRQNSGFKANFVPDRTGNYDIAEAWFKDIADKQNE